MLVKKNLRNQLNAITASFKKAHDQAGVLLNTANEEVAKIQRDLDEAKSVVSEATAFYSNLSKLLGKDD